MASGDTALWLHNKLGSTDDLWSGKTICSQLNAERLQNIQECFHALQPHVKVKLLLSFLHLPRRNVEQVRLHLSSKGRLKVHLLACFTVTFCNATINKIIRSKLLILLLVLVLLRILLLFIYFCVQIQWIHCYYFDYWTNDTISGITVSTGCNHNLVDEYARCSFYVNQDEQ